MSYFLPGRNNWGIKKGSSYIEELGKEDWGIRKGYLFEVTREISYMLVVMVLPELNGGIANEHQSIVSIVETTADLESTYSSSLVG